VLGNQIDKDSSDNLAMSDHTSFVPSPAPLYFPKAGTTPRRRSFDHQTSVLDRPKEIGPVFDSRSQSQPLNPFSDAGFDAGYVRRKLEDSMSVDSKVEHHVDPNDPYLYPMLSRNERLRLTMLWYHTRGLVEDKDFLYRLQEKVNLVKSFIGWDFAICGMVDASTYQRLATANLPLAILPRRESTCSHTILQEPGVRIILPLFALVLLLI